MKDFSSLDLCIEHNNNNLSSTWYCEPTDTELVLTFHAVAPKRYKRSFVQGFVFRIYRACSSWERFHESLTKGKEILERNQYLLGFYDPIISSAIAKITSHKDNETTSTNASPQQKVNLVLQYRGVSTENLIKQLKRLNAWVQPIFTLRK